MGVLTSWKCVWVKAAEDVPHTRARDGFQRAPTLPHLKHIIVVPRITQLSTKIKWTEWLLSTNSRIWDMQLCNFKRHLMWWNTKHFMHENHRVPIVPHKWPIKFMQFSHNSLWMTFPGSRHPTHPSVSRMSLSPRNNCAEWQRDHLPWWVTCDKVMYHIVYWSESPWNKASNPGHVPCWCNRRATAGLFCLRDDNPFKVSTPRETSNLKPNCSEVLTSGTSLLHCIFQRCNGLSLTTRNSKLNEAFVLLG